MELESVSYYFMDKLHFAFRNCVPNGPVTAQNALDHCIFLKNHLKIMGMSAQATNFQFRTDYDVTGVNLSFH